MLKIKDFKLGETVSTSLLIKDASIKLTKAQKPYLLAVFTDGTDDIQGNDWDYGDKPAPNKGIVVNVTGSVSEYMGKKQIKVSSMHASTVGVEAFAPKGDVDINEYVEMAKALISQINNIRLRDFVQAVFSDNGALWKTIPSASGVHHAFVAGNLKHSVDVATKAKAMAELIPGCNVDLCIAGGLVHDMGKLWTYALNGALIEMTDEGQMLEHIVIGIKQSEKYRTKENSDILDLIQHIISSHHGVLEYGSPTTPRFLEAWVINYCDGIDAKAQHILELEAKCGPDDKFTEKSWIMNNRQMYTRGWIYDIMQ